MRDAQVWVAAATDRAIQANQGKIMKNSLFAASLASVLIAAAGTNQPHAQEQSTGLMNRGTLAPDRGMIFPFDEPRQASFWMKNTLIPLDMIFIRPDGRIANIEANTVPLSLQPVYAIEPVSAVLELAGGRAAELGIKPGDTVKW